MSYTQLTILSLICIPILDIFVFQTKLLYQKKFWLMLVMVIILQTIVDNYLNGRWFSNQAIVGPYDPKYYSGIRIWHTPLENYGFGIALISLNIMIFEKVLTLTKSKKVVNV
jgi:lycopene cyclase domain-containing protein